MTRLLMAVVLALVSGDAALLATAVRHSAVRPPAPRGVAAPASTAELRAARNARSRELLDEIRRAARSMVRTTPVPRRMSTRSGPSSSTSSTIGWPWTVVAACEWDPAQRWATNTGNGFFGGLQFTQQTWDAFGGRRFAARADLAAPAQQVTVGERVLAAQGWGAWPVCSQGVR